MEDKIKEIFNESSMSDKDYLEMYIEDIKKQRDFWFAQYERLLDTITRLNKTDIKIQNKIGK